MCGVYFCSVGFPSFGEGDSLSLLEASGDMYLFLWGLFYGYNTGWFVLCTYCLLLPKKPQQWLVCEREIVRRVGVCVVFAWVRGCWWCRMCCFGACDWRWRMVIREGG